MYWKRTLYEVNSVSIDYVWNHISVYRLSFFHSLRSRFIKSKFMPLQRFLNVRFVPENNTFVWTMFRVVWIYCFVPQNILKRIDIEKQLNRHMHILCWLLQFFWNSTKDSRVFAICTYICFKGTTELFIIVLWWWTGRYMHKVIVAEAKSIKKMCFLHELHQYTNEK